LKARAGTYDHDEANAHFDELDHDNQSRGESLDSTWGELSCIEREKPKSTILDSKKREGAVFEVLFFQTEKHVQGEVRVYEDT